MVEAGGQREPREPGGPLLRFLRGPFDRSIEAMEPIVSARPVIPSMLLLGLSVVAAWHLYVPLHELLHAAGCAWTGGTVKTLEVQAQYGGTLLAHWFSFVQPGGEYAGRLSDFDTHGSDAVYLATDALPFALSLLLGPLLLRLAARGWRPIVAGPGFVLGLAPFYNIPGDYFEMGAILVTGRLDARWQVLRSDDVFRLIDQLVREPSALGLAGADLAVAWPLVLAAALVACGLAYLTWGLGDALAKRLLRA